MSYSMTATLMRCPNCHKEIELRLEERFGKLLKQAQIHTLRLFLLGLSYKEIAARQNVTPHAIAVRIVRIAEKLGFSGQDCRIQLMRYCLAGVTCEDQ
jgi:DNA-binding NarL/FixJ family response regulator